MLVVDKPFQADRRLAQRGLPFTNCRKDHATDQPQRQGIARATGLDAAQHHRTRHTGALTQPGQDGQAHCGR